MKKWYLAICVGLNLSFGALLLGAAQQTNALSGCCAALVGLSSQEDTDEWDLYVYKSTHGMGMPTVVGKVVFSMSLDAQKRRVGEIKQLAVAEQYRGHGYGSAFFIMGCNLLRSLGVERINLQMLPEQGYEKKLEAFYTKLGCIVDTQNKLHVDLQRCERAPFHLPELASLLHKYSPLQRQLYLRLDSDELKLSQEQKLLQAYVTYFLDYRLARKKDSISLQKKPENTSHKFCSLRTIALFGLCMLGIGTATSTLYAYCMKSSE